VRAPTALTPNQLNQLEKNISAMTLVGVPLSTILNIKACLAAVRRVEIINENIKNTADEFESFKRGPVEPVLNPQATDDGGIKGGIELALKILRIDSRASKRWNVDDAEDVQAEVLSRVQRRLDQMEISLLLQLGWKGLARVASQELADAFDKLEAKRRGGAGGRKVRKIKKSVQEASYIRVREASRIDEIDDAPEPGSEETPSPATLVLAVASKLGHRAHQYFEAIAAGANHKSAAQAAGITPRMGRKYQQQLRALLTQG